MSTTNLGFPRTSHKPRRKFADDDIDFNFITSEAESLTCLEVKHWEDLKQIYLSSARFAGSIEYDHDLNMESQNIFNIIFIVLSIWETLNGESIEHRNRYNELRQQAKDDFDGEVHVAGRFMVGDCFIDVDADDAAVVDNDRFR